MATLNQWVLNGVGVAGAAISPNGRLAAWGASNSTQFGMFLQGSPNYLSVPSGRTVKSVCVAHNYTVIIYDNGSMQVIGANSDFGRLGTGTYSDTIASLTTASLANGKLGKKVVTTEDMTIVLCTDGTVQGAGRDRYKIINPAIGESLYLSFTQSTTFAGKTITDIAGSTRYNGITVSGQLSGLVAIDSSGEVYCIGEWLAFSTSVLTKMSLPAGKVARNVFAANSRAFVICTDGSVYMFGAPDHSYQRGFPGGSASYISTLTAAPMPSGQTAQWIGVGNNFTMMVTAQGNLYSVGYNGSGQLGLGDNSPRTQWTQVTTLAAGKIPSAVQAGIDFAVLIYNDGTINTVGDNTNGRLGVSGVAFRATFGPISTIGGAEVKSITSLHGNTAPGAPTITTVTPGNQQVSVAFTEPANGGAAIRHYNVKSTPGGIDISGASSPIVVTGLTNGTAYTFKVTATNSEGTSVDSSASVAVTPRTFPGAPTGVSAVAGNRQAVVSFTDPASNGGSAITGYTVTASPGGATASGASSPLTVTGLTNGTAYTFTAKATNGAGDSSGSLASSSVTPAVAVVDLNSGNISAASDDVVVAGSRTITAKKQAKSAGAVSYAPDAANKPSVAISNIPASVQDVVVGVAATDASGIAVVKIVALASNGSLVTNFVETPLTVRVTLPGFTSAMATIQTSATLGGAITDTITAYKVGTELYEFTTTHLTYFSASQYVPCFVAGTRILTAEGYKAVETLTADDLIRTADNRIVPFRMFKTHIATTSPETAPYTIPANTFGRACPAKELTVSPYHAIQSGANAWQIPKYAAQMFSGITQAPAGQAITYYHLELPNYFKDNIVAEGTVVESYGNRQTAGMKAVYRLNAERTGFTRMEKTKSAKKTA